MKKTILGVCLFLGGLLSAGLWTVAEALAHLGGGGPLAWYLSGSSGLPVLLLLEAIQTCIAVFPLILFVPVLECLLASLFVERAFLRLSPTQEDGSGDVP